MELRITGIWAVKLCITAASLLREYNIAADTYNEAIEKANSLVVAEFGEEWRVTEVTEVKAVGKIWVE